MLQIAFNIILFFHSELYQYQKGMALLTLHYIKQKAQKKTLSNAATKHTQNKNASPCPDNSNVILQEKLNLISYTRWDEEGLLSLPHTFHN